MRTVYNFQNPDRARYHCCRTRNTITGVLTFRPRYRAPGRGDKNNFQTPPAYARKRIYDFATRGRSPNLPSFFAASCGGVAYAQFVETCIAERSLLCATVPEAEVADTILVSEIQLSTYFSRRLKRVKYIRESTEGTCER